MSDNMQYQPNDGELDVPEQPLAQDYGTPSEPPTGTHDSDVPIDHPLLDSASDIDSTELNDVGLATAAGYDAQLEDAAAIEAEQQENDRL